MTEVCSVCLETLDDTSDTKACRLPGCNHLFHLACVLDFAQYDVRCPICRQVPLNVTCRPVTKTNFHIILRSSQNLRDLIIEHTSDTAELSAHVDEEVNEENRGEEEEEYSLREAQLRWRRYAARRRRVINRSPRLRQTWQTLRRTDVELTAALHEVKRMYKRKLRDIWRNDADLFQARRLAQRLRRRQLRLSHHIENEIETRMPVDEI